MQPEVDAPSGASTAAPTAARRAAKALSKASKGVWGSFAKGSASLGSMFKGPEKPAPTQTLELQEMPAHRKSTSISSSVVSSEMEQQI